MTNEVTRPHKTRFSDSSQYDEVCVYCGKTDAMGPLKGNCPKFQFDTLEDAMKEVERFRGALTNIKNVKLYNYVFDGYEKEIQRLVTEALESK